MERVLEVSKDPALYRIINGSTQDGSPSQEGILPPPLVGNELTTTSADLNGHSIVLFDEF